MRTTSKLVTVSLLIGIMLLLSFSGTAGEEEPVKIGIAQLLEHPALNAIREGTIDGIEERTEADDIEVLYRNAQGEVSNALSIAENLKSAGVDIMVPITTPVAQAALETFQETPIVATGITNFVVAGLVDSMDDYDNPDRKHNVTGVSNQEPLEPQLKLVKQLKEDVNVVGVLHNPGEANSTFLVEKAREIAPDLDLELVVATANKTADVSQAAQSLQNRVDALWVPTDNTVVAALPAVSKVAVDEDIPLVVADTTSIKDGSLVGYGFDYYTQGKMTAEQIIRIMEGAEVTETPIVKMGEDQLKLMLNLDTGSSMDYRFSADLAGEADAVVYQDEIWDAREEN